MRQACTDLWRHHDDAAQGDVQTSLASDVTTAGVSGPPRYRREDCQPASELFCSGYVCPAPSSSSDGSDPRE
jgi:hypothetical protein